MPATTRACAAIPQPTPPVSSSGRAGVQANKKRKNKERSDKERGTTRRLEKKLHQRERRAAAAAAAALAQAAAHDAQPEPAVPEFLEPTGDPAAHAVLQCAACALVPYYAALPGSPCMPQFSSARFDAVLCGTEEEGNLVAAAALVDLVSGMSLAAQESPMRHHCVAAATLM